MKIILDITPIAKPRMTRSDAWKKRPAVLRYWVFKEDLKILFLRYANFNKYDLCFGKHITFVLPMPLSWSKRKKALMTNTLHQQKPDVDNMLKAIQDCLFDNDSFIADIWVTKIWGKKGAIIIEER